MVIDARLLRLTALEKTIRHIAAPRLTYGRIVNNPSDPQAIEIDNSNNDGDRPPREGNPIGAEMGNEPPSLEERLHESSSSPDSSDASQRIEEAEPAT